MVSNSNTQLELLEEQDLQSEDISLHEDVYNLNDLPIRDWEKHINFYQNITKKKFPLTPLQCSIIIQHVQLRGTVKVAFDKLGVSYTKFKTSFDELSENMEELLDKEELSNDEKHVMSLIDMNPYYILGKDIDRANAINYDSLLTPWETIAKTNPQGMRDFVKHVHPERFGENDKTSNQITIKIGI